MTVTAEDVALDRTPPQDHGAEQCVLGGMMLSKDAIADAVEIVNRGDFYRTAHAVVYDAILDLYGRDEPADPGLVTAYLASSGDLTRIGGAGYLHDCVAAIPTPANTSYYARIVAARAKRRRLVEAGHRITQLGYSQDGRDEDDLVDLAQQTVYDLTERAARDEFSALADLIQPAMDHFETVGAADGYGGISTGFADLDRVLCGLHPGQVAIVAGRPSMGKSTLATDIARHAAKANIPAAIFSLEMSKLEIVTRVLAAESKVPLHVLRTGRLTDEDWGKLARCMGEVGEAPLFIDDSSNLNLAEIRAKARRLKQRHGLRLIVVDYLQLMSTPKRAESREREVAELSRGLKLLAKEVECPIIVVSQLNRGPEQRADKRPMMADLRESGSQEQDADIVILLHREDYYDKGSPRTGEADLIVAKSRNGPQDTVTVAAQLHIARFVDMALVDGPHR
jgi:replicative DNA helicase